VFSLTQVRDQKVKLVACGETHTVILSQRASDSHYSVKTSGSNDKYQLGIVGMKRDFI
jgi:alpha-tubulin suppressor-like RCC1 family protein